MDTRGLLRRAVNRFASDTFASLAPMIALAVGCIAIVTGVAIDYGLAEGQRERLQAAADSAAIAALRAARAAIEQGDRNWTNLASEEARRIFGAAVDNLPAVRNAQISPRIIGGSQRIDVQVGYSASYLPNFLQIAGVTTVPLAGVASASQSQPDYMDIYLLIDSSPSMGIGATTADQDIMQAAVGCTIGCHVNNYYGSKANMTAVRASGAVTRIDIVRIATQKFISDLKARAASADQFRIRIDLFNNRLIPLLAPTTNLDDANSAAAKIDLIAQGYNAGTNISEAIREASAKLTPSGDGTTAAKRKSFVLVLTDGVENSIYGAPSPTPGSIIFVRDPKFTASAPYEVETSAETIQTIKRAICDPLKAQGHMVLTGHINYGIPPWLASEKRYAYIARTLTPLASQELAACATQTSYAFEAANTADIGRMFNEILKAITEKAASRLTQ